MSQLYSGKPRPGTRLAQMDGGFNRSCVGAWLFGEQGGRYLDSSKTNNPVFLNDNGGSDPFNIWRRVAGRLGGVAYWATGTKRNIAVSQKGFSPPNGSWTFSTWVNPTEWHDYGPIASQWDDGPSTNKRSWAVIIFGDGTVHAYSSSNGSLFRQYGTSATLPKNTWTHVAVVYPAPGGTPLIYFNGVAQATPTTAGTEAYNGTSNQNLVLYVAYIQFFASTGSFAQNCYLEGMRLDTRILSADEILWMYKNQWAAWNHDKEPSRFRSALRIALLARGFALSKGKGNFPGVTISMKGRGLGESKGRLGGTFPAALRGKGKGQSTGHGATVQLWPLKAKGKTISQGRVPLPLLNGMQLMGRSIAKTAGKVVAYSFGDWVAAFSAFFWDRKPPQ